VTTAHTAAVIIARARESYRNGEVGGSTDAFDYKIGIEGIARYGELYQETYALANENHPVKPGDGQDVLDACKERADALWAQVLPELEAYAANCRAARYTGWSPESGRSLRRAR
jgi:hypothetical protein